MLIHLCPEEKSLQAEAAGKVEGEQACHSPSLTFLTHLCDLWLGCFEVASVSFRVSPFLPGR